MSLWDQVKTNMLDWYTVAADKTEEMARIGVRRYDKFGISREIERELTQLGNHVYSALTGGRTVQAADHAVRSAIERIQALERQLVQKDQEIEAIRAQHRRREGAGEPAKAPESSARDGGTAGGGGGDVIRAEAAAPVSAPPVGAVSERGAADVDEHALEAEPLVTAWSEGGPVWDGTASDWGADPDEDETLQDDWRRREPKRDG